MNLGELKVIVDAAVAIHGESPEIVALVNEDEYDINFAEAYHAGGYPANPVYFGLTDADEMP